MVSDTLQLENAEQGGDGKQWEGGEEGADIWMMQVMCRLRAGPSGQEKWRRKLVCRAAQRRSSLWCGSWFGVCLAGLRSPGSGRRASVAAWPMRWFLQRTTWRKSSHSKENIVQSAGVLDRGQKMSSFLSLWNQSSMESRFLSTFDIRVPGSLSPGH